MMTVMTVIALTTMGYFSFGVVGLGVVILLRLLNDYFADFWLGSCSIYLFS